MAGELFPLPVGSPFGAASPAQTPVASPAFGAPTAPPMAVPPPTARQAPGAPNFQQMLVPILASIVAGRGDPAAVGAGLAAFQRGRQLKRAEREDELARTDRERRERADFYSRMVQNAQQFDDPVAFEQWKQAVAPMAEVYGVPLESVVFSDTKRKAKDQKLVQDALDQAVKRHGPEILNRPDVSVRLADGRTLSMPTARNLLGGEVTAGGEHVPVKVKPEKDPDAPADLSRSGLDVQLADAKRRAARGEPGAAEDVKLLEDTILKADTLRRDPPRITVNTGAADSRVNTRVDRVGTQFASSPIVKEFNEVQAQYQTIKSVVGGRWTGPNDMSIIFGFMKALDPNSVVRETEYDNASKSGNIFAGWAARFNGKLNPSGGFLSEQVRKDFLEAIAARYKVKKQQYDNLRSQTSQRIDRIRKGAPETGDEALTDFAAAFPDETTPAPVGPAGFSYQDYLKSRGGAK